MLRPDDALNNAFVYCLAIAAKKHGVLVHALGVMSNHYHLVLTGPEGVLPCGATSRCSRFNVGKFLTCARATT